MTPKEYLQQIRKLDILIDHKNEQLCDLKLRVTSITPSYEGERVRSSGSQDKLGETVTKIMMLKDEINSDIDQLVDLKREIMKIVDSLGNPEMINLLYRRYFKYEKWEKIAYKMNYSIRGVHKLHGKALQEIDEKIKCAL